MTLPQHFVRICKAPVSIGVFFHEFSDMAERGHDETRSRGKALFGQFEFALVRDVDLYLVMVGLGLLMFAGAHFADRSVARHEPRLAVIEPSIPLVCFASKTIGMMIAVAGLGAVAAAGWF